MLPLWHRGVVALIASVLILPLSVLLAAAPSSAAPGDPLYSATSGASRVTLLGGTVTSGLTATSSLSTGDAPRQTANSTVALDVLDGLIEVDSVSTRQSTARTFLGGTQVTSQARIAGLSLLDGAITASVIDTRASAKLEAGKVSHAGNTTFVGLKIAGVKVPLSPGRNFTVEIPGLAKVVVNKAVGTVGGSSLVTSAAAGLEITLLEAFEGLGAGSRIELTPSLASIGQQVPVDGVALVGGAYATSLNANIGDGAVEGGSGRTSAIALPPGGTGGIELTNALVALRLAGVIEAKALASTVTGTVDSNASGAETASTLTGLNLLNGLIKASVVKSHASVAATPSTPAELSGGAQLVNLTIAGRPVPVTVPPNTTIRIPGVARVVVNEQIVTGERITVRALHVTALEGAPAKLANIDLHIGVAYAGTAR